MNVLLAIDDDPVQIDAITAVRAWLPEDAKVVVLHVSPSPESLGAQMLPLAGSGLGGYPYVTPAAWPSAEELDRQSREVAGRAAQAVGGRATVESGNPAETIVEVAERVGADLIVVGTGDRGWWSVLLEPSVGTKVAREAPCSVLLVRSRTENDDDA